MKTIIWESPDNASRTAETFRTFREGEVIGEGFGSGGRFQYVIRGGKRVKEEIGSKPKPNGVRK